MIGRETTVLVRGEKDAASGGNVDAAASPFAPDRSLPAAPAGEGGTLGHGSGEAIVGIDIGGTKMLAGLLSPGGELISQFEIPTRPQHLVEDMVALVQRILDGAANRAMAVGIGSKGLVDRSSGVLIASQGLGVQDIRLAEAVERATGLKAIVDNDVHAATIGEIYFGAGQQWDDFILYNAGTGLAAGFVFNGRLHRGANNYAGEVGCMPIDQRADTISEQGLRGCAEGLVHDARRGVATPPVALPNIGPPPRLEYGYVAINIIQLLNVLNPSALVLTGGMFSNAPHACEWVRQAVLSHAMPVAVDALEFFGLSRTAPATGLVGAAALVLEANDQPVRRAAR